MLWGGGEMLTEWPLLSSDPLRSFFCEWSEQWQSSAMWQGNHCNWGGAAAAADGQLQQPFASTGERREREREIMTRRQVQRRRAKVNAAIAIEQKIDRRIVWATTRERAIGEGEAGEAREIQFTWRKTRHSMVQWGLSQCNCRFDDSQSADYVTQRMRRYLISQIFVLV